jgi:hypothetical protein
VLPDLNVEAKRKSYLYGILEAIGQQLDPTPTEYERARTSYEAVASFLTDAESEFLQSANISPHGSVRLQTANRPWRTAEFDVDLLLVMPDVGAQSNPKAVKDLVGDRLKQSERYRAMLHEKNRCWQIQYAGEFHLDVTPAIVNPKCNNGGLLVPDRSLRLWKETHPIGYAEKFEARAKLQPRYRSVRFAEARADIEGLPEPQRYKGVLKRGVQLSKRDRDVYFSSREPSLAPISIIITTLLSWSYENCVRSQEYDHDLDILIESVRGMPNFIQTMVADGRQIFVIPNETTLGENFAEKWNEDRRLSQAFFEWHAQALGTLEQLVHQRGEDTLSRHLERAFGAPVIEPVFASINRAVNAARTKQALGVASGLGISTSALAAPMRSNTFFGRR